MKATATKIVGFEGIRKEDRLENGKSRRDKMR